MNVSQPDDHEVSQEAITIRVTSHLYTAMSVDTGVDSITKLSVLSATKTPVSHPDQGCNHFRYVWRTDIQRPQIVLCRDWHHA